MWFAQEHEAGTPARARASICLVQQQSPNGADSFIVRPLSPDVIAILTDTHDTRAEPPSVTRHPVRRIIT